MATLYEQLGGETAVMAAVDIFYAKVLGDPLTKPFFIGLAMDAQIKKQVAFMTRAFGGPDQYRGRDLGVAHAHLVKDKGLADVHFDAVATHLQATLRELGVDEALNAQAIAIVASTRNAVLGRG
ncbi:MAG: group 1 truncated hemoglobin [Clostridia bacterium]|nr:group 1 truncated hemoglobin [Deltaproteobacteria bacterium]